MKIFVHRINNFHYRILVSKIIYIWALSARVPVVYAAKKRCASRGKIVLNGQKVENSFIQHFSSSLRKKAFCYLNLPHYNSPLSILLSLWLLITSFFCMHANLPFLHWKKMEHRKIALNVEKNSLWLVRAFRNSWCKAFLIANQIFSLKIRGEFFAR
jgi:hypothetical protein